MFLLINLCCMTIAILSLYVIIFIFSTKRTLTNLILLIYKQVNITCNSTDSHLLTFTTEVLLLVFCCYILVYCSQTCAYNTHLQWSPVSAYTWPASGQTGRWVMIGSCDCFIPSLRDTAWNQDVLSFLATEISRGQMLVAICGWKINFRAIRK